jgi:Bacterial pre-peptidase C-terminal domain
MDRKNLCRALPLAAALVLAACSDTRAPLDPSPRDGDLPGLAVAMTCTATVQSGDVKCDGGAGTGGGALGAILAGQNTYVRLTASNHTTTADSFFIDVTVTNLIPQPLGTTDGETPDPAGVRVFFTSDPVSTTGGTVTVANPDGTATLTAANQEYFQYDTVLVQDDVSDARTWKFQLTPEVTRFTFTVLVSAEVQYPEGYIAGNYYVLTLNPGESRTLPGSAYTFTGDLVSGETPSWTSSAPAIASVSGTQVTAGGSNGFAELTPSSGSRAVLYTTAVSVCPAPVVTSGTSSAQSIAATDCFSSYGSSEGRPTTSYYADLYRVNLAAGQTLTVTLDSGDELDTYLLLAAPVTGFLVAGNDDDDEGALGVGSRIVYTADVAGTYVIEASTFNGLDTGTYTLGVTIN